MQDELFSADSSNTEAVPNEVPPTDEMQLRIPFTAEFSPNIVDLYGLLKIVSRRAGDKDAILSAIGEAYLSSTAEDHPDPEYRKKQRNTRAYNVTVGMSHYGLYQLKTASLTGFGEELVSEPDDDARHRKLGAHILRQCQGATVLAAARDIQTRGDRVTKQGLAEELRLRGFSLTHNPADLSRMRLWLDRAGVTSKNWDIDEEAFRVLSGISVSELREWDQMSVQQQAFLHTLRHLAQTHGADEVPTKDVMTLAAAGWGPIFTEGQWRKSVLTPLESDGWIHTLGKGDGRGGKAGTVSATPKLLDIDASALSVGGEAGLPRELVAKRSTPRHKVYEDLASTDTYVKGLALEILAIQLATDLGLTPFRMRERGVATGGAEVDLIAEAAQLHFSRWLFQCKNKPASSVGLSELAKEVGMAVLLKAHVIVMVTTGRFSASVDGYARTLAETTPLQVVLVDGELLRKHKTEGSTGLIKHFTQEAERVLLLKRAQVTGREE